MEEKVEKIKSDLKQQLSEKRYIHSLGVMHRAQELAKIYHYDETKAMLTGLVHDIAKEMSSEELIDYAEKNQIPIKEIEQQKPNLLHGKVGAHLAKEKYGFSKEMQEAIAYHTTGRAHMTLLDKIIYVADKTEESRKGDLAAIRQLSEENLDLAVKYFLTLSIQKALEKDIPFDPETVSARNDFIHEKSIR